jgi:hypothetical protein
LEVLPADADDTFNKFSEISVGISHFLHQGVEFFDVASGEGSSQLLCLCPFPVNMPHETDGRGNFFAAAQGLQVVSLLRIVIPVLFYLELPVSGPLSEGQVGVTAFEFSSRLREGSGTYRSSRLTIS